MAVLGPLNYFHIWQVSPQWSCNDACQNERDIHQVNGVLTMMKNQENNGMEEIGLVTTTPEEKQFSSKFQ